jgi:serine protease AprX
MKTRPGRVLILFCILVTQLLLVGAVTGATAMGRGQPSDVTATRFKLSPTLQRRLAEGGMVPFLVVLTEQADLGPAARLSTKQERGQAVYEALRSVARETQAPLRAELEARGVPYRPYYIVNMLLVQGDAALAQALAQRPDVARLEANPSIRLQEPTPQEPELSGARPDSALAIEWGVQRVGADAVWAQGYTGEGIVVAGQDTGYDWDHPALRRQYRGWNGTTVTHDYNWHDAIHGDLNSTPGNPCGFDAIEPCDDNSHGTHTMGTMVGDDGAGNQIGVAPGARWIACRNMEQGVGTPATYAECFEFFLAPYPLGGDPLVDGRPDLAPHVINNSWSCPPSEGCTPDSLQSVIENVRAAGIVVVVSAGNAGSSCGTVNAPPGLHDAAFSAGATDYSDHIAGFSSRGPVTADGSGRPKPDISAPGVNVRSSVPGGGYGYKSGTSMAAPHVAGLVALLWSASPDLIGDVARTEEIIQETARPVIDTSCGGDTDGHPNNVYGWGIVDAANAVAGGDVDLTVALTAQPQWVQAGRPLTFTFVVSNEAPLGSATGVVLSDALPSGTLFARATEPYTYTATSQTVKWNLGAVGPGEHVSVTLELTVASSLVAGTRITNADYGVRSDQVLTPVRGAPAVALVPWRVYLPVSVSRPSSARAASICSSSVGSRFFSGACD